MAPALFFRYWNFMTWGTLVPQSRVTCPGPAVAVTLRFAGMVVAATSPESPPAAVALTARTWKV